MSNKPQTATLPPGLPAGSPPAKGLGKGLRPPILVAPLLAVLLAAVFLSLLVGARPIAPQTVLDALANFDPANGDHAVVFSRIPRTVTGLLAGAALGVAGAAIQGMARNPLGDPGILGLNAGASLAVVIAIG